jgi:RNA polymerase sigma-70 factor (ECF subfamily)
VRAIAAGERAALATLYDRHAARLLSLARRLMNDPLDGEDLLHDLFLEVWQRAYQYSAERGSVTTWLVLRLRSRAIDRLRSATYRRLLAQHEDAAQAVLSSVAWSGPWTAERSERATSDGHLQRALAELPDHTQAILQLVYFRGLSLTEVAAQLLLPIGTVKSRLHRALRSLRSAVTLPPEESGR